MNLKSVTVWIAMHFFWGLSAQGVLIGTQQGSPDASAGLELQFPDRGLLISRITTQQRNSISQPAQGLQIFNLDTECLEIYLSTGWRPVVCACTQPPTAPTQIFGPFNGGCPGDNGLLFVSGSSSGASTYQWSVPTGLSIVSQSNDSLWVNSTGPVNGNITLSTQNSCGTSSSYSQLVQLSNPNASFTPTTASVVVSTTFTPAVLTYSSYSWTFPGGTPASSQAVQPNVTFSSTGSVNVSLTVTDPNGCSQTVQQAVNVINCPSGTQTFSFTGGVQTFSVPACVSTLNVDVYGAQGGSGNSMNQNYGGRVQTTLQVTPGETLSIYVGGQGTLGSGGYNGGGSGDAGGYGGGGASDIRRGGTSLNDRIVVAGGGGGAGFWSGQHVIGGKGGGLIGEDGSRELTNPGGQGGTQTSSGNGTCSSTNNPTVSGGFGFGGTTVGMGCGCEGYGGGSGWYGGGASGNCRGGGGGSSYVNSAVGSNIVHSQGVRIGNGLITISY